MPSVAAGYMHLSDNFELEKATVRIAVVLRARLRGLLGDAEPILAARGRAAGHCSEVFVGIDVTKARDAIAVADGERGGEVRFIGEVDAADESMCRLVKRIAASCDRAHFCYEVGPTGSRPNTASPLPRSSGRSRMRPDSWNGSAKSPSAPTATRSQPMHGGV